MLRVLQPARRRATQERAMNLQFVVGVVASKCVCLAADWRTALSTQVPVRSSTPGNLQINQLNEFANKSSKFIRLND